MRAPSTLFDAVCQYGFFFLLMLMIQPAKAATLRVGPLQDIKRPSEAARVVRDGDVVEIEAGEYRADAAVWRANHLTLRGVGGRVRLLSQGVTAEGKAIWVLKGNGTIVENIVFEGAVVPDRNGAGIRLEGTHLTVRDCEFSENEMGILTGVNPFSDVVIERSQFTHNGNDHTHAHNVYIGAQRSLVFRSNVSTGARIGHQLKSRAANNLVEGNRFEDGPDGESSYLADFPAGGEVVFKDNYLQKGPKAQNITMLAYGLEKSLHEKNSLEVRGNTFVNQRAGPCNVAFIKMLKSPAIVQGNAFNACSRVVGLARQHDNTRMGR
jgi:hypothetical protein